MQDNHDIWNNSMDLAGITNGGIIGFKYFGFGGLAQDTKGLKAFKGIQQGDGATLNLDLTVTSKHSFDIRIMLDDPWKGQEIGKLQVKAITPEDDNNRFVVLRSNYQVAVPAVEGLSGKHAIYLVTEGPEIQQPQRPRWGGPRGPQRPQGLFDLHGIGFSKGGEKLEAPVVPQVTITADGTKLVIPSTPIRFTNLNGYTDQTRYQVYGKIGDGSKLTATADDPNVTFEISPIVEGRATIKATYKGLTKIFLIN